MSRDLSHVDNAPQEWVCVACDELQAADASRHERLDFITRKWLGPFCEDCHNKREDAMRLKR